MQLFLKKPSASVRKVIPFRCLLFPSNLNKVVSTTGSRFYRFLVSLNPVLKLPSGITLINPYGDKDVRRHLKQFTNTFYSAGDKRILIAGINPGRFGAGITGVPFTDPVALTLHCGIDNNYRKQQETSSDFVYRMIDSFGGPAVFYDRFLLSSVCPLGFLNGKVNYNYYDSKTLSDAVREFIIVSLKEHLRMNVRSDVVISLGKKNAQYLESLNAEVKLFGKVVNLEHPRYIMQYRRKHLYEYIDTYLKTLNSF
jgi:hypothetical protein